MEVRVTQANWMEYVHAVRDNNPIHRDPEIARQHGLEGVIAPGMVIAAHLQTKNPMRSVRLKFKGFVKMHRFSPCFW